MIAVRQIIAIVQRELRAWFDHPGGYLLLIVALVFNSFFYFRSLAVNPIATLRPMFELFPWLLLFLVPAVSMRLIAEERKSGTLETALAQPVNPWVYLAGKLLSVWSFFLITFILTLPVVLTLRGFGSFDFGIVAAQYLGAMFLAFVFSCISLAASAGVRHQVTSFLISAGVSFVFTIAGAEVVTVGLPASVRVVAEHLSISAHYYNITRGVLDIRDFVYFITVSGAAFGIAGWLLMRERLSPHAPQRRRYFYGSMLIIVLTLGLNLAGAYLRGRIDFTQNRVYTLSPATKTIVRALPDLVTIKLFSTKELPSQIALVKRDVQDLLSDFQSQGRGNVVVEYKNVEEGSDAIEEARALGITEMQFNVLEKDVFQAQKGMFGLATLYTDGKEVIPFIDRSDDLEYRLLRSIKSLTDPKKANVTFLTGFGEEPAGAFRQALSRLDAVTDTDMSTSTPVIAQETDAAILLGPTQDLGDSAVQAIRNYIEQGGSMLAFIDRANVDAQTFTAQEYVDSNGDLFAPFGARVAPRILADVRSYENVTIQSGFLSLILPYPYWVRAHVVTANPIAGDLTSVMLPWASLVERTDKGEGNEIQELLTTTDGGFAKSLPVNIDPQAPLKANKDELGKNIAAVSMVVHSSAGQTLKKSGRLVLVGSAKMASDQFMQEGSPNLTFALNTVDWLTQDEALISVRSKTRIPSPLGFPSDTLRQRVRLFNLIGVPILVALAAGVRLFIRKKKSAMI
ncbi:MAG: Gldg family protein [Patescibacteria group bacterium]